MPADISSVHINKALASLSVELSNDLGSYMLGQLCARRPVEADADSFFQYGRESAGHSDTAGQSNVRFLPSVTAPGAPAPISEYTISTKSYRCHRYARKILVTDAAIARADSPLSPLKDAGRIMAAEIRNDIEGIITAVCGDSDNYPAGNRVALTTGANGTNWVTGKDGSGTDPLAAINTGRQVVEKSIQRKANILALSAISYDALGAHPDLRGILQYTDPQLLEGDGVPGKLLTLKPVVGRAVWNTAKEGAAYSGGYIFLDGTDSNYSCAIIAHNPGEIGVLGFSSFIWFDCVDETTRQKGVSVRAWREEDNRGYFVEASQTMDVQPGIVDSNSKITGAYFIGRTDIP